jgi:signal transduction histidine kinase
LKVSRRGKDALFRVIDRGCGIPTADQARLFQAFHRGSNVRQLPGTGLGLVIVKRSVALHGGEITFESGEGKGTTFTVRLPLFAQSLTPTHTPTLTQRGEGESESRSKSGSGARRA